MSKEEAQEKHVAEDQRWKHVGLTMAKANNIPMDTVTWLERGEGGVLKPSSFMGPGQELDFGSSDAKKSGTSDADSASSLTDLLRSVKPKLP